MLNHLNMTLTIDHRYTLVRNQKMRKLNTIKKHVSGNSNYSDITSKGNEILLSSYSMCGTMKISQMNKEIPKGHHNSQVYPWCNH